MTVKIQYAHLLEPTIFAMGERYLYIAFSFVLVLESHLDHSIVFLHVGLSFVEFSR